MSTVISADGTPIAYDRRGDGPTVVLIGGAIQHRAIDPNTARVAETLAERFTVLHYDRRGRGGSGDTQPYAPEREIEDIAALIAEVGGPARLYGMSSGAALALDAVGAGLDVTKLAIYEAPFVVDDQGPTPDDHLGHLVALRDEDRFGDMLEYFMVTVAGSPAEMVADMRSQPFWAAFESIAPTLVYDLTIMAGAASGGQLPAERTARWAKPAVPTLVMSGDASPDQMRSAAEAVVRALPNARHEVLADQDHNVAPEALSPALLRFFTT